MKIKRLLSLGIAVVLAIMTTACGTSGTDSTPAKATIAQKLRRVRQERGKQEQMHLLVCRTNLTLERM